jgi:dihydrofolate reductase
MRRLIATEYLTLDGVMEAPGSETSLGERGGWSFLFSSDDHRQFKWEELLASDALLLGRTTYEIFVAAWPARTGEFADRMNSLPKYVVSSSLDNVEWNNSYLIHDTTHLLEGIDELKQQPGQDILLTGSADLFHTLRQQNLIDEYHFMVYPIIVGTGKRLFKDGNNIPLNLVKSQTLSSGVVVLIYRPQPTV